MTTSRLAGLVSLLVLGTALSVWWYLQVPGPGAHSRMALPGPAPGAWDLRQEAELVDSAPETWLEVPSDESEAPQDGRWTRRSKGAGSARAGRSGRADGLGTPAFEVLEHADRRPPAAAASAEETPVPAAAGIGSGT